MNNNFTISDRGQMYETILDIIYKSVKINRFGRLSLAIPLGWWMEGILWWLWDEPNHY